MKFSQFLVKTSIQTALVGVLSFSLLTNSASAGHYHHKSFAKNHSFKARPNNFWWPKQLDLSALRDHDEKSNPYGKNIE